MILFYSRDAPTQGRLQVGPFIISPAFAMIIPGGNSTVSVECMSEADGPRKFEEVITLFNNSINFDNELNVPLLS